MYCLIDWWVNIKCIDLWMTRLFMMDGSIGKWNYWSIDWLIDWFIYTNPVLDSVSQLPPPHFRSLKYGSLNIAPICIRYRLILWTCRNANNTAPARRYVSLTTRFDSRHALKVTIIYYVFSCLEAPDVEVKVYAFWISTPVASTVKPYVSRDGTLFPLNLGASRSLWKTWWR